jgi:hypothetical protein
MAALKAVVSNTAPAYQITAERDDGTVIDLTGCTVTMKLYRNKVQTNTTSGHDACTLVTAATGIFSWIPKAGDLPSAGKYFGDVKVTYSDLTFEVLYNRFELKVRATSAG